eukprot:TRINITY_DN8167_c0_g1_i2.p1 TRINITY_DN8167_c0_g1~~TRINITY_DN8167_c0_g1_i2.p1  ORF type:complete len:116 (-),score=36.20 TRINITY_DN8167_c0_g1_i2:229-576(-)
MKESRIFVHEEQLWKEPPADTKIQRETGKHFKLIFFTDLILLVKYRGDVFNYVKKIPFSKARFSFFDVGQGSPETFQFNGNLFYCLSEAKTHKIKETCDELSISQKPLTKKFFLS